MNVAEAERRVEVVADADGADDVDGEERDPAQQKHSCGQILRRVVSTANNEWTATRRVFKACQIQLRLVERRS